MPRFVIPILRAIKKIIKGIEQYTFKFLVEVILPYIEKIIAETITFSTKIRLWFGQTIHMVLSISESISRIFKEQTKDIIRLVDKLSGKFRSTINESISFIIKIISKLLFRINISLNITEETKKIFKGLSSDFIKLSEGLRGKLIDFISESLNLITKITLRLLYRIKVILVITESITKFLKGISLDRVKLFDKLIGKFKSSINETISLIAKLVFRFLYKVHIFLSISEFILISLKSLVRDFTKFSDKVLGRFVKGVSETITLMIRTISKLFYKFYLNLKISESIVKFLKGIIKDFMKLKDILVGKFISKLNETVNFIVQINKLMKRFYKVYLVLNIPEVITRYLKGLSKDRMKLSDKLSARFKKAQTETINFIVSISKLIKQFYKIYLILNIYEQISKSFKAKLQDRFRLVDKVTSKFKKIIGESINFSIKILLTLTAYKISLTLKISEYIKKIKKGSQPTIFDQVIFDQAIFDGTTVQQEV